jgi:transcriptional activator SPT7
MFGEDFSGSSRTWYRVGAWGIESYLSRKSSCGRKGRMGAGGSLPYVETTAYASRACLLIRGTPLGGASRSKPTEPPPPFPPPPTIRPARINEDGKTKSSVSCGLTTSLASMHSCTVSSYITPKLRPPPRMVSQRSGTLRPPNLRQSIPGQLLQLPLPYPTLPRSQAERSSNNLRSRNHQQYSALPDDVPTLAQTKMGPLGQIAGGKSTNAATKKKQKKEKDPALPTWWWRRRHVPVP